jgi:hypothetical protein
LTSNAPIFAPVPNSPAVAWGDFLLRCILNKSVPKGFPLMYPPPGSSQFIEDGQIFLAEQPRMRAKAK